MAPFGGIGLIGGLEDGFGFLVARFGYQQARGDGAALAGMEHQDGGGHGLGEVGGVFQDDGGGLAAEFEEDALHGFRALTHDMLADGGGAGEGDEVDARVGDQHLARHGRVGGGDDVEDARREAGFLRQLAEDDTGQRCVRGGFEDDGAAGEQRGDDLLGIDVKREIPRRDGADHADGLVHGLALRGEAVSLLGAVILLPVQLGIGIHEGFPAIQAVGDLGAVDGDERGADLVTGDGDEAVGIGHEQLMEFFHEGEALLVVGRPVRGVEGAAGGRDGGLDIGGRGVGGLADDIAGPGADIVIGFAAFRRAQHAVDKKLGLGEHGHLGYPPAKSVRLAPAVRVLYIQQMQNLSNSNLSQPQRHFIDELAMLLLSWGMTITAARLYGYLQLQIGPVSLDEMAADLEVSKSNVCAAAKLLEAHGNARRLGERGSKRVLYVAGDDPGLPLRRQTDLLGMMSALIAARKDDVAEGAARARLTRLAAFHRDLKDAMEGAILPYKPKSGS